jgi:hypothetical protein
MIDIETIREDFPILKRELDGKRVDEEVRGRRVKTMRKKKRRGRLRGRD